MNVNDCKLCELFATGVKGISPINDRSLIFSTASNGYRERNIRISTEDNTKCSCVSGTRTPL